MADGRPLVVQRQRAGDVRDMMIEARVVAAAGEAGVPVPNLLAAEQNDDGSCFMVVEAIDGETIARKIQRDDEYAEARAVIPAQLGTALAAVHRIEPVTGLESVDQIEHYTTVMDELVESGAGGPQPMLELVRRWLIDHRPPPVDPVVVHGDFRLGNLIVDRNGLSAVIDWELAHLGDPMEDLGWLCVKAWRFGQPPPVGGLGEYEQLFEAYEAAAGVRVDPDVVRWWEVMGTWKWAVMCSLQASVHLTGSVRSHELAAIGRRVCESEHDLFLALEGRW
ncbi:phosphotransferase family protein [Ilumatobacter nonamiensis]|uniref:phosphotransferase family protein n=1 Tax=Ilumatobacter nonamiensis TaxID=467093 RepID=UPI001F4CF273